MADKNAFEAHCWRDLFPEDIYRIYEPYRRDTGIKGKAALLLIDLYNLCYRGGDQPVADLIDRYPSSCGTYAWSALAPTQALLEACRGQSLPIIYSTKDTRNTDKLVTVSATNRQRKPTELGDYEIHPQLSPEPDDLMIYKERASCFFGTPLVTYLNRLGIETLIVAGESTSGCVRATVLDAYSYGFHTVVAEECVFDRNRISHQVNLFDLHHKYADVMHIDDLMGQLASQRQT